jgi:hypothetical protein
MGYNSIQNSISPRTCILHLFPNHKDARLNTNYITYSVSTLNNLLILYLTLVRPQLQYTSIVWNSKRFTDAKKLERSQRKFVALCQNCFFTYDNVTYEDFLKIMKLRTLHKRRLTPGANVFFISVYFGLKCCPSLLDVTGIRVLPHNFRNSFLFIVTCKNTPSARRVSAAKYLCKDVDVSRKVTDSLNQNLRYFVTCLHQLK